MVRRGQGKYVPLYNLQGVTYHRKVIFEVTTAYTVNFAN